MWTAATEAERLEALRRLDILDTLPEEEFDALVKAAAAVCDVPISSLVLVDADRIWFKAQVGFGALRELPREATFCDHALRGDDLFEVPDAAHDPRFVASAESGIRFYAGVPVRIGGHHKVGTVCVFDHAPRTLDDRQREVLRGLAVAAGKALESRKALQVQHGLAASLQAALVDLAASREHLRQLYEATPAMLHSIDAGGRIQMVSDLWLAKLGHARAEVIGRHASAFYTEASREQARTVGLPAFFRDGQCKDVPYQMLTKEGQVIDVLLTAYMGRDQMGAAAGFATLKDVTAQKVAEAKLAQSEARYRGLVEDQSEMISLATREGDLQFVNDAYARQFGKAPHELIGKNLFDHVPRAACAAVAADLLRCSGSTEPTSTENQIILPDGRRRWFSWTNRALRDEAGAILIHSVGRDIEEREATARRLRNSEARFRLLSESAPLGVFLATRRGTCTYSNARWHAIFGAEARLGRRAAWFAAIHPVDRAAVAARWAEAARTGAELVVGFRILRDDAVRHLEVRARPKLSEHGRVQGFIGTVEDVTEKAATLQALASSKEALRRLYESTPAMLHSIDPYGRLLMVSDLWLSKLGYTREEVIGHRTTEFMTPESREKAVQEVQDFFQHGRSQDIGYQMVAKDGTLIDVLMSACLERDPDGSVVRSLTVVEDITARLRTERALRDSELRYRRLAEATSDVITQVDMGLVRRYVSPASRRVLGYKPEEMIDLDPRASIHPDDVAVVDAVFQQLVAGTMPGDHTMVTYRSRHKHGHWIWLEVGLNLVRDPETGTPLDMICALRDASERHRVAEEIEAARAAAERAARGKAEFLANMSHELRTPLTGLLGIHDLLMGDTGLAPQHRHKLALAHEAGRSLMAVINDVLDFSKIEAGELTIESVPFDPGALVTACRDFARQDAACKGLRLEATMPQGLTLLGDPTRLRQVLLNLVTNAVKFTADGGVTIAARYDAEAARLHLAVSDTGIGIPADKIATVFERFQQADGSTTRQFGGTGLGLAICRNLVELMGGGIGVTSQPGVGSTFTVEIPATAASGAAPRAHHEPLRAVSPRRLLLAEDNRLNRSIIEEMLTRAGHRVTAVENGADALARLAADPSFDLILMDVQMPVLDGHAATRTIRDREATAAHRIPIVGLTANASVEDEACCAAAGMDAHVAKPIDWTVLLLTIERLCAATIVLVPRVEAATAPDGVLDRDSLAILAEILGPSRLADMLQAFAAELSSQLGAFPRMAEAEIAGCAHSWISMAGHFGFTELQHSASALQADTRASRGMSRLTEMMAAAERAVAAAQSCEFSRAA